MPTRFPPTLLLLTTALAVAPPSTTIPSLAAETTATKPSVPIALSRRSLPNGCLIDAIANQDALDANQRLDKRWSRILILNWQEKSTVKGHALCVFEFNKAIWAYDPASGTIPLTKNLALKTNANELAKLWLGRSRASLLWSELH